LLRVRCVRMCTLMLGHVHCVMRRSICVVVWPMRCLSRTQTHLPPTAPQLSPACDTHAENTSELPGYRRQIAIVHFSVGCAVLQCVNLNWFLGRTLWVYVTSRLPVPYSPEFLLATIRQRTKFGLYYVSVQLLGVSGLDCSFRLPVGP